MSELSPTRHNILPQHIKGAILEGIYDAVTETKQRQKIVDLYNTARPQLVDLLRGLGDCKDPLSSAHAFGLIGSRILSLSGIKHPEGKISNPINVQLLRETLSCAIPSPAYRPYVLEVGIGLGGSELCPSLRTPVYIQPSLEIAEAFLGSDIVAPVIRIFNAHKVSSTLNSLNPDVAQHRANQASDFISAYVAQFYSHLRDRIVIEDLDINQIDMSLYLNDVNLLTSLLDAEPELLNVEEQRARQALERLKRSAQKHSAEPEAKIEEVVCGYAATHGISFKNYGDATTDGVIKLGGQGESQFDVIQQFLALAHAKIGDVPVANINSDGLPQLICLRTRAGTIPPYYPETSELTVESDPSEIPVDIAELQAGYKQRGLLSGGDFDHLPLSIKHQLPSFFRVYLETRRNV